MAYMQPLKFGFVVEKCHIAAPKTLNDLLNLLYIFFGSVFGVNKLFLF